MGLTDNMRGGGLLANAGVAGSLLTRGTHNGSFERSTITQDASGGTIRAWAAIYTGKVNRQSATPQEVDQFSRRGVDISHKIYMASDPGVALGDRWNEGGSLFQVQGPAKDMGDRGQAFCVFVMQVK